MARGRMISKTLGCASRKFARLRAEHPDVGLFAQALYPLLVASADDWGREQGDAFAIKHGVWSTAPDDEATFERALEAMAAIRLIVRYEVDGESYLSIVDFDEHQTGLHKRTASRFPEVPGTSGKLPEPVGNSRLREENRTEEKGTNRTAPALTVDEEREQRTRFERFWAAYPRQAARQSAWDAWLAIRPTEPHAAEIMTGVDAYRQERTVVDALSSGDFNFVALPENWLRKARWTDARPPSRAAPAVVGCRHTPVCHDAADCTSLYLRDMDAAVDGVPAAAACVS